MRRLEHTQHIINDPHNSINSLHNALSISHTTHNQYSIKSLSKKNKNPINLGHHCHEAQTQQNGLCGTNMAWTCPHVYEAHALHLGCCIHVGHVTCLGHFCVRVPAMSFKKKKKRIMGHGRDKTEIRGIKYLFTK